MGSTFTHSLTEPIFHPTPNYNDFLYHMPSMNADDESVRGWLREWFGCTKEAGEETWMLDHGRYFVDFLKLERVSINGWEIRAYSTVELATVLYTSSLTAFAARHIALDVKIAKKLERRMIVREANVKPGYGVFMVLWDSRSERAGNV